jgi:hypothetical protein
VSDRWTPGLFRVPGDEIVITMSRHRAEQLRSEIRERRDGIVPTGTDLYLLTQLNAQGVSDPEHVMCCECGAFMSSMLRYHSHLMREHGWPEEDAGSESGRRWRSR